MIPSRPLLALLLALAAVAPCAALRAEPPAAAALSPKDELLQVETRLKELNKQTDAHPELAPLKDSLDQAERKFKIAAKDVAARLDPEGKFAAMRQEAKNATPERQAEIKGLIKEHEKAVATDSAIAPLSAERDAAKKTYNEKRKALLSQNPDYAALEKRRNELKKQLK